MENSKASLVIESLGGASLGRCYSGMSYKVTSEKAVSMNDLLALRELGFLGHGQEFYAFRQNSDDTTDFVPTLEFVPGDYWSKYNAEKVLRDTEPTFTVTNEHGIEVGRYVYECESRVDSSD